MTIAIKMERLSFLESIQKKRNIYSALVMISVFEWPKWKEIVLKIALDLKDFGKNKASTAFQSSN